MAIETEPLSIPDFTNTEIAFQNKSDAELRQTARLFQVMNNPAVVKVGESLAKTALRLRLPFVKTIIKQTIFKQFCGGLNLMDCQEVIDELYKYNVLSLLDYGVEAKTEEVDLENALQELINAIDFAASNHSVPAAVCKLTALVPNGLLAKKQRGEAFTIEEEEAYERFRERLDTACQRACEREVGILLDAEESWTQDPMDEAAAEMMSLYNKKRVTVYNTYQLYRKDRLAKLKSDFARAQEAGYMLGAKCVRGAYMDKERERAKEMGYPSPIQDTKEDTDRDFDAAIGFCLEHYEQISLICATHNVKSTAMMAQEIISRGLPMDHPHLNFSQLQGMSDYLTFNLAKKGFNVAKYIVYGPVHEVTEYLIRRAEENTSVTGEASRELRLIQSEMDRRGIC